MSQKINFEGQILEYNHATHTAFTSIREIWKIAGKQLGWNDIKTPAGLSFNVKIINFILQYKATLIVRIEESGHDYWMPFDSFKSFLENHNCYYLGKTGVEMRTISITKFIRVPRT